MKWSNQSQTLHNLLYFWNVEDKGGGIAGIPHTSRTNFVLICRNISSSINLLFMKCGQAMLSCWLVARWFGGQRGLEP